MVNGEKYILLILHIIPSAAGLRIRDSESNTNNGSGSLVSWILFAKQILARTRHHVHCAVRKISVKVNFYKSKQLGLFFIAKSFSLEF